jgi:hypothetical protein
MSLLNLMGLQINPNRSKKKNKDKEDKKKSKVDYKKWLKIGSVLAELGGGTDYTKGKFTNKPHIEAPDQTNKKKKGNGGKGKDKDKGGVDKKKIKRVLSGDY